MKDTMRATRRSRIIKIRLPHLLRHRATTFEKVGTPSMIQAKSIALLIVPSFGLVPPTLVAEVVAFVDGLRSAFEQPLEVGLSTLHRSHP